MINETEFLCPLRNEPCTDKCAWADIQYDLSENGVGRNVYCAVAVIAGHFLSESGEIDEYID